MSDMDCSPTQTENERALQACFNRGGVTFQPDSVAWRVAQTWCYGNSYSNSVEIVEALGIDPDMPLSDLADALIVGRWFLESAPRTAASLLADHRAGKRI